MKTIINFNEIAKANNLNVVDTTHGAALVGFDSFEQAEKVAAETGLSIEFLSMKDGDRMYKREFRKAYEAMTVTGDDFGPGYTVYEPNDAEDLENAVSGMLYEIDDKEAAEAFRTSANRSTS